MIDTLRLIVGWGCNRICSYCCNKRPETLGKIEFKTLNQIDWTKYTTLCISGGEPLLYLNRFKDIYNVCPTHILKVLYTNGDLLSQDVLHHLCFHYGITTINVSLHGINLLERLERLDSMIAGLKFRTTFRIHIRDTEKEYIKRIHERTRFRWEQFKFWTMDECTRDNEDRVYLVSSEQAQLVEVSSELEYVRQSGGQAPWPANKCWSWYVDNLRQKNLQKVMALEAKRHGVSLQH